MELGTRYRRRLIRSRLNGRHCDKSAHVGFITARRPASTKIFKELGPSILARTEKDCVGMGGGFVRKRSNVQPTQSDKCAAATVVVRDGIRPVGRGDVHLNHDQLGSIVE